MVINTQQTNKPDPTLLPHNSEIRQRRTGRGAATAGGGDSVSLPAPRGEVPTKSAEGSHIPLPQTGGTERSSPTPKLTDHLLEDLLNPSIGVLDLCNYHELSLAELDAIINSEAFHIAKRTIESVSRARRELLQPEAETLALARMTDLLKDKPETERHAETARKAAAAVLRAKPRKDQPPTPASGKKRGGDQATAPARRRRRSADPSPHEKTASQRTRLSTHEHNRAQTFGPLPLTKPITSETRNSTTNRKNRIIAISVSPSAIPPNPKTAAMIATMKKTIAHLSMARSFLSPQIIPGSFYPITTTCFSEYLIE